jgi:protein involved in polysaccharide export with SLBB domain
LLLWLLAWTGGAQVPVTPAAPATGSDYVLQRGDDLEVRAYNMAELDAAVRIRPDGKISVVLLNDVVAAGLTPQQLAQNVTEGFAKHFRDPKITVIVKSFASQNVFVGGEVALPASLPLRGELTAVQAVVQAGGIKDATGADEVTILHKTEAGQQPNTETVSVNDVMSGRKADTVLQPSDVVYVNKSSIQVYIGGEVVHPGMVPLHSDMTMLAAVFQAGGFKPTAKTDAVVLLRDSGKGTPIATKVKLNDVFLASASTKLKPFDVVFVPKSKIAKIDQWMEQYIRQVSPAILSVGFSYLFGMGVASTPF